jgi:hypothetical protein
MWDLAKIGKPRHVHVLHRFIAKFGMYIHAFELGGLRSWEENQAVLDFAAAWKKVLFLQFHDSLAGTALPEHYSVRAREGYGSRSA